MITSSPLTSLFACRWLNVVYQFKDIRPKVASGIELVHAGRLLGHAIEDMTKKVYRRVGETVSPTK